MSTEAYTFAPLRAPFDFEPRRLGNGGDADEGTAWVEMAVDAATAEEAEKRVLSYTDHNYEDDLRGAIAAATPVPELASRYVVRVTLARPRN